MKKVGLLLFVISCISSIGIAQVPVKLGAEVGVGWANMHYLPAFPYKKDASNGVFSGRIAGVVVLPAFKHLHFQSGLAITNRGQDRAYSFNFGDTVSEKAKDKMRFVYAEVPLNMLFKTGKEGNTRVVLGWGVSFSYMLKGTIKHEASGEYLDTPYSGSTTITNKGDVPLRRLDFGVNWIGGVELPSGWMLSARYYSGVKDLGSSEEQNKQNTFYISAIYQPWIKKMRRKDEEDLLVH